MSKKGIVLVLLAVALFLAVARPSALGGSWSFVIVSGRSMEPAMQSGDVAVAVAQDAYAVGDVVAYRIPSGDPGAGALVIHRIAGGSAESGFETQGDNRGGRDEWRPKPGDIVGKAVTTIPVGPVLGLVRTPSGLALLAALVTFVFVFTSRRDDEAEEQHLSAERVATERWTPVHPRAVEPSPEEKRWASLPASAEDDALPPAAADSDPDSGDDDTRATGDGDLPERRFFAPRVLVLVGVCLLASFALAVVTVYRPFAATDTAASVAKEQAEPRREPTSRGKSVEPRKPDFVVPGAPPEPANEMPLPARARMVAQELAGKPPTEGHVAWWMYQHAWIVTGAEFGWQGGAEALRIVIAVDEDLQRRWGIGSRSAAVARAALAEVRAARAGTRGA